MVLATAVFVVGVFGRNATAELPIRPAHVAAVEKTLDASAGPVVASPAP